MGDFFDDFFGMLKFSVSWFRDWAVWRTILTMYFVIALVVVAFGIPAAMLLISGGYNLFSGGIVSVLAGLVIGGLGLLVLFLVLVYYGAKVMLYAFDAKKLARLENFSLANALDFLLLHLLQLFYALFSVKATRFLWLLVAGLLLYALAGMLKSVASFFLVALGALLGFTYMAVVVYMGLRLSQAIPFYLSGIEGKRSCLDASWKLSEGRVLRILGFSVCLSLVMSVLSQFILLPVDLLGFSAGPGFALAGLLLFAVIAVPLILLVSMFSQGMQAFFGVAMYANLLSLRPQTPVSSEPLLGGTLDKKQPSQKRVTPSKKKVARRASKR